MFRRFRNFALLIHKAVDKGIFLFGTTIAALIIANSRYVGIYEKCISMEFAVSIGQYSLSLSAINWINDLLMAIFFLVVGMEIKKELLHGQLSDHKQRLLPLIAACAGVFVPISFYFICNHAQEVGLRGWAIPAATDIAFALGVLGIFGKSLPRSLRIFLTALAIIDDLIAISVIAIFYTDHISLIYLAYIAICIALLLLLNYASVSSKLAYLIVGSVMWLCFLASGIHATIAGVLLGFCIPIKTKAGVEVMHPLEKKLIPLTSYVIIPLFAFANSGITFSAFSIGDIFSSCIIKGITMGLFVGKQLGIFGISYILYKLGFIQLPKDSSLMQLYGVSIICGIGFTMSLFISVLAFNNYPEYLVKAKIGIIIGSLLSLTLGTLVVAFATLRKKSINR